MGIETTAGQPQDLPERERWSSRSAFYFAAIGAAVGFGNVWRFPSLVFEYGGGAFFVPYILALFFIGLPLLVLEISLGQYYETGDVDVYGGISKRLRGVGLSAIASGYMGSTYYTMLLAWVAHAFFDTFRDDRVWTDGASGSEASEYFMDRIIGTETLDPDDPRPTRVVWKNVGCAFLVWVIIYVCVIVGIKWMGRITYVTMGLPVILLFVMLGKAISLEGSEDGIQQYLSSDWSVLVDRPEVWPKAVSQIFFSIGINFGMMTAYGSHCRRDEPALLNSSVVAVSNSLFSFVAGFAVFAALGHLAYLEDAPINDLGISGFGLIFGSWPVVFGTLPGGIHWVRLLFFMLFCLGIDSAFSFLESALTSFGDTVFLGRIDKRITALGLVSVAFLASFLYATDAGLMFLDVVDYYINFVMLLVGFAKCSAAGWLYNIDEQIDNLGASLVFSFMVTTHGSVFLACILWFGISNAETALISGFAGLVVFYVFGMAFVGWLMHKKMQECPGLWNWKSMCYDLMFRNVMDLRDDLCGVVGYIPTVWPVLIKFFIPPVLLVMFCVGCSAKNSTGQTEFGHYSGYPLQYQMLGIMAVVFVGFLIISSLMMPRLYSRFEKHNSPVPSKDATVHAAPKETTEGNGTVPLSLDFHPSGKVWPPRSIQVAV